MGILSGDTGDMGVDDDAEAGTTTDGREQAATVEEPQVEPAKEPEAQKDTKRVEVGTSRRDRWKAEFASLRDGLTKGLDEVKTQLAQRDATIAELRGSLTTMTQAQQFAQQQAQPQSQPKPNRAAAMFDDAAAILSREGAGQADFKLWQQKYAEAVAAQVEDAMAPRFQQQAQPQYDPRLMAKVAANPVVMNHPRWQDLLEAEARSLIAMGYPQAPQTLDVVIANVARRLSAGTGAAANGQVPAATRAALSGTHGTRAAAPAPSVPHVELTPEERRIAAQNDMSEEEYARQIAALRPDRVRR